MKKIVIVLSIVWLSFSACGGTSEDINDPDPEAQSFSIVQGTGYYFPPTTFTTAISENKVISHKVVVYCDDEARVIYDRSATLSDESYDDIIQSFNAINCDSLTRTNYYESCEDQALDAGGTTLKCSTKDLDFYDGCMSPSEVQNTVYELNDKLDSIRAEVLPEYDLSNSCD